MPTPSVFLHWLHRDRFPLLLLLFAAMCAACLMPAQSDTWWQLRAGQEMWRSGTLMLHDQFTHTVSGQRWPNHEWLTQVLFFLVHAAGGMALLTALCALAVTASWAIASSLTAGAPMVRVAFIGAGVMLSASSWSLRPQVLTMALFSATLWMLVRRRGVWCLPVLFLVWANLHGAVALGGALITGAVLASFMTRDRYLRTLIPVGGLCLAATALTPLGWELWLEIPFSLQRLQTYGVDEWRAPGLTNPTDIGFWMLGAATFTMMVVRRHDIRTPPIMTLATSAFLLFVVAMRSARHITPFVLCAIPTLSVLVHAAHSQATRRRSMVVPNAVLFAGSIAGAVAFIAHAWSTPIPRLQWNPMPAPLIAAISACDGRLYNRYDEGGYLIWFMPDRKVFMDSRQDPFPRDLVLEHMRVEQSGDYRTMFERYDIGCALTPHGSVLAARLKAGGWAERAGGEAWSIFSRPAASPSHEN